MAVYSCEFPQHNKDIICTYCAIRENIGYCLLNPRAVVNINKFGYETEFLMRQDYVQTFKQRLKLLGFNTYDSHYPAWCSNNVRMSAENQEFHYARTYAHSLLRKGIKPNLVRMLAEMVRKRGPSFERLIAECGFLVADVLDSRRVEIRNQKLVKCATFRTPGNRQRLRRGTFSSAQNFGVQFEPSGGNCSRGNGYTVVNLDKILINMESDNTVSDSENTVSGTGIDPEIDSVEVHRDTSQMNGNTTMDVSISCQRSNDAELQSKLSVADVMTSIGTMPLTELVILKTPTCDCETDSSHSTSDDDENSLDDHFSDQNPDDSDSDEPDAAEGNGDGANDGHKSHNETNNIDSNDTVDNSTGYCTPLQSPSALWSRQICSLCLIIQNLS